MEEPEKVTWRVPEVFPPFIRDKVAIWALCNRLFNNFTHTVMGGLPNDGVLAWWGGFLRCGIYYPPPPWRPTPPWTAWFMSHTLYSADSSPLRPIASLGHAPAPQAHGCLFTHTGHVKPAGSRSNFRALFGELPKPRDAGVTVTRRYHSDGSHAGGNPVREPWNLHPLLCNTSHGKITRHGCALGWTVCFRLEV